MIRLLALLVAAFLAAGCQFSLWAGPLDEPYELNVPGRAVATPAAAPAP